MLREREPSKELAGETRGRGDVGSTGEESKKKRLVLLGSKAVSLAFRVWFSASQFE